MNSTDFSLINCNINFHQGCLVDILDDHSENYLIEFLEKDDYSDDFLLVKGYHGIPKFNFLSFSPKRFSVDWRINVYGWENEKLKHLVQHTYTHYNKNILLYFKSDSIPEQNIWINELVKMVDKYKCNITIVSKYSSKLFTSNPNITIVKEEPSDYKNKFYSSYVIGYSTLLQDYEQIPDITYFPKDMKINTANGGNFFENKYNKIDLTNVSSKVIIKNILNL